MLAADWLQHSSESLQAPCFGGNNYFFDFQIAQKGKQSTLCRKMFPAFCSKNTTHRLTQHYSLPERNPESISIPWEWSQHLLKHLV